MTDDALVSIDTLLAEAHLMGVQVGEEHVRALVEMGVLPNTRDVETLLFPQIAVALLVQYADVSDASAVAEATAICDVFQRALIDRDPASWVQAVGTLDTWREQFGVLGALAELLPLLAHDALDTLRGPARLEWRILDTRQLIVSLAPSARALPPPRNRRTQRMTAASLPVTGVRKMTAAVAIPRQASSPHRGVEDGGTPERGPRPQVQDAPENEDVAAGSPMDPSSPRHAEDVAPAKQPPSAASAEDAGGADGTRRAPPSAHEVYTRGDTLIRQEIVARAVREARLGALDEALANLDGEHRADFMTRRAVALRDAHGITDAVVEAWRGAYAAADATKFEVGIGLSDVLDASGCHDESEGLLRALIEVAPDRDASAQATVRLGTALVAQSRSSEALELYVEVVASRRHTHEVIERARALLSNERRFGELLDMLRLAAEDADSPREAVVYFRQMAEIATEHLDNADQALLILGEGVDATSDDGLANQLADLARAVDDVEAELKALNTLTASEDTEIAWSALLRAARLLLERGDSTGARALFERVFEGLQVPEAGWEELESVMRGLRELDRDPLLYIRWLKRRAAELNDPFETFTQWRTIVSEEMDAGVDKSQVLVSIDVALTWASDAGISEDDTADLHMLAARLKGADRRWESAAFHAVRGADTSLATRATIDETKALLGEIGQSRDVDADVEHILDTLQAPCMAADDAELPALFGRACIARERWRDAVAALERAVALADGKNANIDKSQLFSELSIAYEKVNIAEAAEARKTP